MNAIDIAVILILLVSGALALMRGFVHEVLSISAWLAATLLALHGLPLARPLARQYISSPTIADAGAGAAIFLVSLVLFSLITHAVSKQVQQSALGSVDRSLGFVFGLARGALLVSLAYMVAVWIMQPEEPDWLREARTRPVMVAGASMIEAVIPDDLADAKAQAGQVMDTARRAGEAAETLKKLDGSLPIIPPPKARDQVQPAVAGPAPTGSGPAAPAPKYDAEQRRTMDQLFQSNQ